MDSDKTFKTNGVDSSKFGLHSFRSGGATSAANNGVIFQRHGRWKCAVAKSLMSMTASSKDSQFLSFRAFNFSRLFSVPNTLSLYRVWVGSCQALPK